MEDTLGLVMTGGGARGAYEPGLRQDYDKWPETLAPHEPDFSYAHNRTGEDNADAHMKRQIMCAGKW